jgi:hypothetical protein
MRLRFACRKCEGTVATGEVALPAQVPCPACGTPASFAAPGGEGGVIEKCLRCGGPHLFLQKEFPRRVGLAITVVGAGIFLVLMGFEHIYLGFGTLLAVALLDSVIYSISPVMTVCYHCRTEFRRAEMNPAHGAFDPKIAFYTAKQDRGLPDAAPDSPSGAEGGSPRP